MSYTFFCVEPQRTNAFEKLKLFIPSQIGYLYARHKKHPKLCPFGIGNPYFRVRLLAEYSAKLYTYFFQLNRTSNIIRSQSFDNDSLRYPIYDRGAVLYPDQHHRKSILEFVLFS
jgi:hypothetical protein